MDTNVYADFCRGDGNVRTIVEAAHEVYLPFVVVGELRGGFAVGEQGPRNEGILRRFLLRDGIDVLFADDATTVQYGAVYRQLRRQGTPIPTNDMWIAALALQHNLILCARDRHFDHLPQIARA